LKFKIDIKKNKKPDEINKKLIKHGSKMHESHNLFLIAANEFNSYSLNYLEKIFPNLVESFQATQEKLLNELYLYEIRHFLEAHL
jgi:hypothetical protein